MKIACFTVAAADYFPQQEKTYGGGNALNQSLIFSKFGYKSYFIGAVGSDEWGTKIIDYLKANHINISHLFQLDGNTATNQIINDEKGERYGIEGAWQNGVYGDFKIPEKSWKTMLSADLWVTHCNCPDYLEALKRKTNKQKMSVDFLHLESRELLEKSLPIIDIAFIGGTPDMIDYLVKLSEISDKLIVLTLGAEGSIAFKKGKQYIQSALPLDSVVDTTGCGDAFQAGFAAEYFISGNITVALQKGAEAGRLTAMHYGATDLG